MSEPTQPDALDELAGRARAALERSTSAGPPGEPGPPDGEGGREPESIGTAAQGQARAVVGGDGRVRELTIEAELLARPLVEVAEAARLAVNQALSAAGRVPELGPVVNLLREAQTQARRDLGQVSAELSELGRRLRRE